MNISLKTKPLALAVAASQVLLYQYCPPTARPWKR